MFNNTGEYEKFRATVKIWIPSLVTLDGTDFKSLQTFPGLAEQVKSEMSMHIARYQSGAGAPLATIPEKKVGDADEDVFEAMKKKQAAAGGTAGTKAATYAYNKTAHRKYNSQKTLFERILKSHSEGNRFIRNDDL